MIETMKDAFTLKGKNAIVTGGNRGLGKGIVTAFAQQGANVAILCRDETTAKQTIDEMQQYGGKYVWFKTNIRDFDSCKAAVDGAIAEFGRIDILVNNSGVSCIGEVLDMDEDLADWYKVVDTDLNGTFRMMYLVGKHMKANGGGRVINISSNAGDIVNKPQRMAPYNTAKAAVNRLTKCLAFEWGEYGIRVNAIAPGYTHSDLSNLIPKDEMDTILGKIPLGRFGQQIEIGALAVFLASEASEQMTGAVVTIDGGYSLAV